jgi:hypothetical protein
MRPVLRVWTGRATDRGSSGAPAEIGKADRPPRRLPDGGADPNVAGIPRHVSPHSLRPAAITNTLDAGVPLRDAQILAQKPTAIPSSTTTGREATSTATASTASPPTSQACDRVHPAAYCCQAQGRRAPDAHVHCCPACGTCCGSAKPAELSHGRVFRRGSVTGRCCLCQIGRCAAAVRPSLDRIT